MKTIKPNTILPKGGKLLKPFRKQTGSWVEMTFDAEVKCEGVRWLRVKGGMSNRGDREDWVADIRHVSASVHDYQFRPPYWGLFEYPSFESACKAQLKRSVQGVRVKLNQLQKEVSAMEKAIRKFPL